MSTADQSLYNANVVETLPDKAVAVVDLVAYSNVARMLEENGDSMMVLHLNRQIEQFIDKSLGNLSQSSQYVLVARTGDGAIVMFDTCADAFLFSEALHEVAASHNSSKTEFTAKRLFRIGIAFGDVTRHLREGGQHQYAGITIANAVRLESAAEECETVVDALVYARLPQSMWPRFGPEERVRGKREEVYLARRRKEITNANPLHHPSHISDFMRVSGIFPGRMTRRGVIIASGAATLGVAAGIYGWPKIDRIVHRLPKKRFVAIVNWPIFEDTTASPLMSGLVDGVGNELIRAEAVDGNLLIIPNHSAQKVAAGEAFKKLEASLGTNLVLALSGKKLNDHLRIAFSLFEASTMRVLRTTSLNCPIKEEFLLEARVTELAADLLDLGSSIPRQEVLQPPSTHSADAFGAFAVAETLRNKENDAGLSDAIQKYQEALEFDPNYAEAHARLGAAYFRLYYLKGDSGALDLAKDNCDAALRLNPSLVDARVTSFSVMDVLGDEFSATQEISKALELDPNNAHTLVYQGQYFTKMNRWKEAEATLIKAVAVRTNYWFARNELGITFYCQARYSDAIREFRAARLVAPGRAMPLTNIAVVFVRQGKFQEAKDALERSLALSETDSAKSVMSSALRGEGNALAAVRSSTEAVGINPSDCGNWIELGDGYAQLGDVAASKKAFAKGQAVQQEALDTNRRNGPGWISLALCLAKTGAVKEAESALTSAEAYPHGDMDSLLNQVRVLRLLDRSLEAKALLERCRHIGATEQQIALTRDLDFPLQTSGS